MEKDPLPFCVCEFPNQCGPEGSYKCGYFHTCLRDLPPQGEKKHGCCYTNRLGESCPIHNRTDSLAYEAFSQEEKCEQGDGWVSHVMSCPFKGPNTIICPNAKESSVKEEVVRAQNAMIAGIKKDPSTAQFMADAVKETPVEGWEAQYDRIYENGTGAEMKEFVRHLAEERQRGREEEKEHILGLVLSILGEYDGFEIGQTREKIRKLAAKSPREGAEGP